MDDRDRISQALAEVLDTVGRDHLSQLNFRPVTPATLDEALAQTFDRVSPSFLPLAVESSKTLAVHLYPGRALADSPLVLVDSGERGAKQLCSRLANLPGTLWLWSLSYFEDEVDVLDAAAGGMAGSIPGANYPREALSEFEEEEEAVSAWSMDVADSARAWRLADPDHPWAHLVIDEDAWDILSAEDAHPRLSDMLARGPGSPEEVAQAIGCGVLAGIAATPEDSIRVFSAEAFRNLSIGAYGQWSTRGDGVRLWDGLLQRLGPDVLAGTPYEALAAVPRAYSGSEAAGVAALTRVANAARDAGDQPAALAQLRNAALVSLMAFGELPAPLFVRLAGACDRVSPDSLAAAVARHAAVAIAAGP